MILANPATGSFFRYPRNLEAAGYAAVAQRDARGAQSAVLPEPRGKRRRPQRMAAAAGWTEDQFKILFSALVQDTKRTGAWETMRRRRFLSNLPRTLWDTANSVSRRCTNPPIDPLRESHVMSLAVHLSNGVVLPGPLIGAWQLAELSTTFGPVQKSTLLFPPPTKSRVRAAVWLS